jgi:hypothetical protein
MLLERKPKSYAYVWYGEKGQGVDLFHHRLTVELREKLKDVYFYEVRPEWPPHFYEPANSFEEALKEAFEVDDLRDIPARIREKSGGVSGKQVLVYVRHRPVYSPEIFNPKLLKLYVEWWDCCFEPLLNGHPYFALLGISFVVNNPPKFRDILINKERIKQVPLNNSVYKLLDEMESIAKEDLMDFIRTHNIWLPFDRKDEILEGIMKRTKGHYEMTLEELKDLAARAWEKVESEEDEDDEDYELDY